MLSILIPTYNRSDFLLRNLKQLTQIIQSSNHIHDTDIIITDNNSQDGTYEKVQSFIMNNELFNISCYLQKENIGLEKNVLTALEKSSQKFIMFLGDDDYISYEYFNGVFEYIQSEKNIGCIIPSYCNYNINGNSLKRGRDLKLKTKEFTKGFYNCFTNSWRGHQMSGLVFKRERLYKEYNKSKISNIYPFLFFSTYSTYYCNTVHYTDYPIKVTQPGQDNKAWDYGDDGLVNELFDNYNKIDFLSSFQLLFLKFKILRIQKIRLFRYLKDGMLSFIRAWYLIGYNTKGTFSYKILFPFFTVIILIEYICDEYVTPNIKRLIKKILRKTRVLR